MNIEDVDVLTLIPQRPPFVMISKLLSVENHAVCAELLIGKGNILSANGTFTEAGIIEHIAQTCAAGMGYANIHIYNNTIKIGFLSAIRNLNITRLPKVGETLHTQISLLEHVMGMTLIKSEVKINDEIIAEGEIKIFITDIDNEVDT